MLSEILKKLDFKELLNASLVQKSWRKAASPIIANSAFILIDCEEDAINKFRSFSINYKFIQFWVSIHGLKLA